MTGQIVLDEQNNPLEIQRLAAQRQLYAEEKLLTSVQLWLAVFGSLGIFAWTMLVPSQSTQAAGLGIVLSLVDCFVLQHFKGKKRKAAAKIQELFDCSVLNLAWNDSLIGEPPTPESVIQAANRHPKSKFDKLQNWYLGRLFEVPLSTARIICQITNVSYDQSLRERYIRILLWFVGSLLLITAVVACVSSLPTDQLCMNVLGPLAPALSFAIMQVREHKEVISNVSQLRSDIEKTWKLCKTSDADDPEVVTQTRALQDHMFLYRSDGTPLFDFVYWHFRQAQEMYGEDLANFLVDEYNAAKKTKAS